MSERIPLIGPRSRYLLLQETPTWVYHKMAAGISMAGDAPETATTDAETTDPEVSSGVAAYKNLTKGGLFTILYKYKKPMVVEAIDNSGTITVTIVDAFSGTSRTAPTPPFKVSAGEVVKATCVGGGAYCGLLVREDIPAR